jgi:hypothetical protein
MPSCVGGTTSPDYSLDAFPKLKRAVRAPQKIACVWGENGRCWKILIVMLGFCRTAAVAYGLLLGIAAQEDKLHHAGYTPVVKADPEWIFKMFSRCYNAAAGDPDP